MPADRPSAIADGCTLLIWEHGQIVWRLLRAELGRAHHSGGRCSQRFAPTAAPYVLGRTLCGPCSSAWADTMLVLAAKVERRLGRPPGVDIGGFVRSAAVSACRDARDQRDAERGLATRPDRRVKAKWVDGVIADELDRVLLLRALYFARSEGPARGASTALPYERWADELELDATQVVRRVDQLLDRARRARPGWVETNIDRPLSERLAAHGCIAGHELGPTVTDRSGAIAWSQ